MRALLMLNPLSRRGSQHGDLVRSELDARGISVVESPGFAEGADCIIVAGGDGTFVRAIERAVELHLPLGVVPLGTFNELARTLGIPLDVAAACDVIAGGRARTIDVARVNGVYYVNEASIGISSRIARLQTPSEKQRFGWLAIVATTLQAFRHARPIRVRLTYDDKVEHFKTIQLTIANSHRFGGIFSAAGAAIDDGWLDLYSIEIANVVQAVSVARAIFSGTPKDAPGLRTYRATSFHVHTAREHRISADGEPAGNTPATFDIHPQALRVFVPLPQG